MSEPPRRGGGGLAQLGSVFGAVVGSTTVLTSVLFYFGWSRAYWFYDYLGIDSSLLGLSSQDYLQLSVDGLFLPLAVASCAGLVLLWSRLLLRGRVARPRWLGPLAAAGGLLLVANGLSRMVGDTVLNRGLAVAPLCIALGVVLLLYAMRVITGSPAGPEWTTVMEWTAVFVLVGLSLFWAANDYSAAVGRSRARQLVAELPSTPDVVLYSTRDLGLSHPGVTKIRCSAKDAAYRYRYSGLKLILQSGGSYLFLPTGWTKTTGVTFVVPRNDGVRLDAVQNMRSNSQGVRC